MKLSSCNLCSLARTREHICFSTGRKPASVMYVLPAAPQNDWEAEVHIQIEMAIKQINFELKGDYYKTYVIKCHPAVISSESVLKCRKWLLSEIDNVHPHLIVLFGKLSVMSVLGTKHKNLKSSIIYLHNKKKYFVASDMSSIDRINDYMNRILVYIRECYK